MGPVQTALTDAAGTGAIEVSDEVWLLVLLGFAVVAFTGFRANSRARERQQREAAEREAGGGEDPDGS